MVPNKIGRELTLHYLYSFTLLGGVSFTTIYLPLVLHEVGYGPQNIGLLLSIYNFVGLAAILSFGRLLDMLRCYRSLILGGLIASAIAFSRLLFLENLYWSLGTIIILAIGFLPQVSLLDSYVSMRYQREPQNYGRIRSLGSLGYVFFLAMVSLLGFFEPYNPWGLQLWALGLYTLVALLFAGSSVDSLPQIRTLVANEASIPNDGNRGQGTQKRPQPTGIQTLGWPLIAVLVLFISCWSLIMGINANFLALFLRENLQVKNIS
ncbi:MAG: MFS transporter, partial [Spirochaetota bacterium]